MADDHGQQGGHPAMDYAEHEKTYNLFIAMSKWTVILTVILLVGMAYFLV